MKTCPFCAEDVQEAAIVCKHCGRDLPAQASSAPASPTPKRAPTVRPVFVVLAALFFLPLLVMGAYMAMQPAPSETAEGDFAIPVDAIRLAAAYGAGNEIAADKAYKGKRLRVTGTVTDVSNGPTVNLRGGVQARFFAEQASRLANVRVGQVVEIDCVGDGQLATVFLKYCTLR